MGLFDSFTGGDKPRKGNGLKQVFEAAKPALNLSADQEQKIKEIFKDFREERNEIKDAGGDNLRDDIRAARKEARQQLMDVLNDHQKKIVQEKFNEGKEQH